MAEGPNEDPEKKIPWKEAAKEMQQSFCDAFCDIKWDCYKGNQMEYLERNVGYAMFGPPKELPDEKNHNTGTDFFINWLIFILIHPNVFFFVTNKCYRRSNMTLQCHNTLLHVSIVHFVLEQYKTFWHAVVLTNIFTILRYMRN
jgi:hypothetical protein